MCTFCSVNTSLSLFLIYRNQISANKDSIERDIRYADEHLRAAGGLSGSHNEVKDCSELLSLEWKKLREQAEVWQNQLDNALANLRLFENDLNDMEKRYRTFD